mgnify:CR=1 FL=1
MTTNPAPFEPVPAFHVYTGPDGETHVEPFAFPLGVGSPSLSALVPVNGIIFRRTKPGLDVDFHPAPRRQFVITIQGEGEIETLYVLDDWRGRGIGRCLMREAAARGEGQGAGR